MMKKWIAVMMAAVLSFSLTACEKNDRVSLPQSSTIMSTESAGLNIPSKGSSVCSVEENSDQAPNYIQQEILNTKEQFYFDLSQGLYLIKFHKEGSLTDKEKAAFFQWVIANKQYEKRWELWWSAQDETYQIPLSDMKDIIFTHLDTDEFHPEKAFPEVKRANDGSSLVEYDAATEILNLRMVGGFGGAAAFEVLDISYQEDTISMQLGIFEMESFYGTPQKHILKEKYHVIFQDNPQEIEKFKVLYAKII